MSCLEHRPLAGIFHGSITLALAASLWIAAPSGVDAASNFTVRTLAAMPVQTALSNRLTSGDYNGDGFDDIAVVTSLQRKVRIYFGSAMPDTVADVVIVGPLNPDGTPNNFFGNGMASGDFDGDGFADLVVGAPLWGTTPDVQLRPGRVFLYRGGSTPHTTPDLEIAAPAGSSRWFGIFVFAIGDPNGDGRTDWYTLDASVLGRMFWYFGGSPPDGIVDYEAQSVALAGGGDWNADGFDDVASADGNLVTVLYGGVNMDFVADASGTSSAPRPAFGDVDGDGIDDLIMEGDPGYSASVLHGSTVPDWTVDQEFDWYTSGSGFVADLTSDACADLLGHDGVTFGGPAADPVVDIPLGFGYSIALDFDGNGKRDFAHAQNGELRVSTLDRVSTSSACADLVGNGYVGIFADEKGRGACGEIVPGTTDTLYVLARPAGATAAGFDAADFRVEVTNPTGYTFTWEPAPDRWYYTGPNGLLDLDATNLTNEAGAMIGLPFPCSTDPNTPTLLARVFVTNQSGSGTEFRVKRRLPLSYPAYNCPLWLSCSQAIVPITPNAGVGFDPIAFTFGLNQPQCPQCTPPFAKETLWLDAHDLDGDHIAGPVATSQLLRAGVSYIVTVDGNCSLAPSGAWVTVCGSPDAVLYPSAGISNGMTGWDAEFNYATPFNPNGCPALPAPNNLFQMATVKTFQHLAPENPTTSPTSNHFYKYIVVGADRRLQLRHLGTLPSGYGRLRATVEEFDGDSGSFFSSEEMILDVGEPDGPGKASMPQISRNSVLTSQVLSRWHNYRVTVRGNFMPYGAQEWTPHCGNPDMIMDESQEGGWSTEAAADGEFVYAHPGQVGSECPPIVQGLRFSLGAGDFDPVPEGAQPSQPNSGHVYSYVVAGQGMTGIFFLQDLSIGAHGRLSILVEELGTVDVAEGSIAPPRALRLLGNAPDPFNPSTVIRYELPSAGVVGVEIYDVRGRVVRHLFLGRQEPGLCEVRFDARDDGGHRLASGVYFAQVVSPFGRATDRLTLLK